MSPEPKNSLDTTASAGAEIIAAATGTVYTSNKADAYGTFGVQITLSDGHKILNGHLMDVKVTNGQTVHKGDIIGYVSNKKPGQVNHLHFHVEKNGSRLPLNFGVWKYPADGPKGSNGEWSGTKIESPPPLPPKRRDCPTSEGVYVREHDNFGGEYTCYWTVDGDFGDELINHDRTSSINFIDGPGGYIATLYEHPNYQGASSTFVVEDVDLGNDAIGHDRASSIRVQRGVPIGENTSRNQSFREAYARRGNRAVLGNGIYAAGWWGTGENEITVQHLLGGSAGDAAITADENRDSPIHSVPAYVMHGGVLALYKNMGGPDSWLGPLTSDEFWNANNQIQQNFRHGYIAWNDGNPQMARWPGTNGQWRAEYRNGANNLSGYPTWVQNEDNINYNWGGSAPGNGRWGVWADGFTARWTKRQYFEAGAYKFVAGADDGIRVWVDGNLIIDQWKYQSYTEYTALVSLGQGKHDLKVEYFELDGGASINVRWERTTAAHQVFVPATTR